MIENIRLAIYLFQEALVEGRLLELFRQQIFRDRIATPAEMDLMQLQFDKNSLDKEYQFVELSLDMLNSNQWTFPANSPLLCTH